MTKLTKRQVLLDKIEAEVGVAETVDAAVNAVLALSGTEITPEGEKVADDRLSDTLSKQPHAIGRLVNGLTRQHELRGGGITGSVVAEPDYSALLQSCALTRSAVVFVAAEAGTGTFAAGETVTGFTSGAVGSLIAVVGGGLLLEAVSGTYQDEETLTGSTSEATATATAGPVTGHQYTPLSNPDLTKTITTVYYRDGHKFTVTGCRSDLSLSLPVGQPGKLNFTQQGRFTLPVEAANPTPTLSTHKPPLCVNLGLAIGSYALSGVNELTLALGNTLTKDEDLNAPDGLHTYIITDRTPTGSVDPKADALTTFDPWTAWKDGTLARLAFLLGSEPGNRIFIEAPSIQYVTPAYGDREGTMTTALSFELKGVSGDDELRLVYF
ncbi:hypothetical protein [Pseudodesulfovibrio pelocollis]|uniref:hypothetical protein n=1 Tax=Pseudodesulfovibrio pelocollis TaxID=3051432 RepID=UPI00255ADB3D|nr:hypothetical protein [Pseudodesulfovibrio sp. SB368]